jgi:hypothetical protein
MIGIDDEVITTGLDDREIKDWRLSHNMILLHSSYPTEKKLRDDWEKFNNMTIQDRIESDWKSIDLFGFSNIDRYETMLSEFLKNDIPDELYDNLYVPMKESYDQADEWNKNNLNKVISKASSLKDLEKQWGAYNSIPVSDRYEVDDASIELFDMDNTQHYLAQRKEFLKNDINHSEPAIQYIPSREEALRLYASKIDIVGAAKTCARIKESTSNNISDIIFESAEKNISDKINMDNMMALSITPFYSPYEMEKLGISTIDTGIYSDEPDTSLIGSITTKQWFQEYKNRFNGFNDESYVSKSTWVETVEKLYSDYDEIKESGDMVVINSRKQSILDLGWNPEIEFNEATKTYANNRINSIVEDMYSRYRIIDVEESVALNEESANSDYVGALREVAVRPLYIVFFNSKTVFNKVIRTVTNSVYSHVSISFDPSLKTMYSFDAKNGGFSPEYMKDYINSGEVKAIQVFCTFIDAAKYDVLQSKIKEYSKNKKNLGYSFINLVTIPFKINYIDKTKMVCSQFVDSMLKLADLDITSIGSNMISPGKLNKSIKKYKGDIYKIYTGSPDKYSADKIANFIDKLASSTVEVESNILKPFLSISSIKEAKEFPVQFTDDGDLLISKGKDIDFEGEYSRCHIALEQYDKVNNIEAMKYCIYKLWYMNIVLEERIHEDKSDRDKIKEYHKARAKIINDIKTYMHKIQKVDKKFDIIKEYNESPFSSDSIKIRRSTLLYSIDLFKRIIGIKK